jgi:hypothetical protein
MKVTKIEIAGAAMNSTCLRAGTHRQAGLPRAMAELTRQNAGTILAAVHLPTGKTENLAISTGSDQEDIAQRVAATVKLARKLDGNENGAGLLASIISQLIDASDE